MVCRYCYREIESCNEDTTWRARTWDKKWSSINCPLAPNGGPHEPETKHPPTLLALFIVVLFLTMLLIAGVYAFGGLK